MTVINEINKFERAALEAILKTYAPEYEDHVQYLLVEKRENTGVGLYVDFSYRDNKLSFFSEKRTLGQTSESAVRAEIEGLEHGAGFVLYIDEGKITMLEVFCQGDNNWPDEILNFSIIYLNVDQ
jgi:hypothetical protein